MGLHKLTAGDGYTYLTRQVAAHDSTEKGSRSLGDYYSEQGESPGRWLGTGLRGLGMVAGAPVTEAQMKSLFGLGRHPDADQLAAAGVAAGASQDAVLDAGALGRPFNVYDAAAGFQVQVAREFSAWNTAQGRAWNAAIPADQRASIRTTVATGMFREHQGRAPQGPRELSGLIARASRQKTTAVAGYDLTFSPVKSVSTLWALAPAQVAGQVQMAHDAAVADTLGWLEREVAFTRVGRAGARQVAVRGLVVAGFTHRDSRAGDPDLHTHVAVSNKVQTEQGRWLALDGRVLYPAKVAASERYNTRLEAEMVARLGVRFADRDPGAGRRPVREIVGINPLLMRWWSRRRRDIEVRRASLAADFQAQHGRPPTAVEALALAQQATLETRGAKHAARSEQDQRTAWHREASNVLGGASEVAEMLTQTLGHHPRPQQVTTSWVTGCAAAVIGRLEESRATWRVWHVRAEAERQARAAGVALGELDAGVDQVVQVALGEHSVPLGTPDPIAEPAVLRRVDGESVYQVHGAASFTSTRVLEAEQRLVHLAQEPCGGRVVSEVRVGIAVAEEAANGIALNDAQAAMVHDLATSGRRVQLALAPAGTGKTTAMRVLARAWTDTGGYVVGLAPSAQAAQELGHVLEGHTDTLTKLTWTLTHVPRDQRPGWIERIGARTLVIIDETGQAGTTELAAAVDYITGRGGTVRMIGDDQQLAAVGAGGTLRDIEHTVGAATLSEVRRFDDHGEAAATLAVREGDTTALGFYADNARIHVGALGTVANQAYGAWAADRDAGRESILLAPTRELVTQLNARARRDRIDSLTAAGAIEAGVRLTDGTRASNGDLIVTRRNERRLAVSGSDWVKNGDRWAVEEARSDGSLQVRHLAHRRPVVLPPAYVAEHVQLGYAATVHAAQGMTTDTAHVVLNGEESRQLLYVALSRGRSANHLYLADAHDGDPHSVIRPETLLPPTAIDILAEILERDGSQHSATTTRRELDSPTTALHEATLRYHDALGVAAEHTLGEQQLAELNQQIEALWPGLTREAAYPVLRSHLALHALAGTDPLTVLLDAATVRELGTAEDRAAVLDWRVTHTDQKQAPGPLPWLAPIPPALQTQPDWGPYLHARAQRVTTLAQQVRHDAQAWSPAHTPVWATALTAPAEAELRGDLAVWRAAFGLPDAESRATGPRQPATDAATQQRRLEHRLHQHTSTGVNTAGAHRRWRELLPDSITSDPAAAGLFDRLSALDRAGLRVDRLLDRALAPARPLPDEHPADALWWRIVRHLGPAALRASRDTSASLRPAWTPTLQGLLGTAVAQRVIADPSWPALVAAIQARPAEWSADDLLAAALGEPSRALSPEELCSALIWRVATLTDPPTDLDDLESLPPDPLDLDTQPPPDLHLARSTTPTEFAEDTPATSSTGTSTGTSAGRILELNRAALGHYARMYRRSWGPAYLDKRLGTDLNGDPRFTLGYAPPGPCSLIRHLTEHSTTGPGAGHGAADPGATAQELIDAGLARRSDRGDLIDTFRDRLVFPIHDCADVVGFIARRNPTKDGAEYGGPKYLNTRTTRVFTKGEHLFGLSEAAADLAAGALPVLVEGPLDAIAVTLSTDGRGVGIAPLGTAFTVHQADRLRGSFDHDPAHIAIATDPDAAGRLAAQRAFWRLAQFGADPRQVTLPDGLDPADLLHTHGPHALAERIAGARPLAASIIDTLIENNNTDLDSPATRLRLVRQAGQVIGALPPGRWTTHITHVTEQLRLPHGMLHLEVVDAGQVWTTDPATEATRRLAELNTPPPRTDGDPVARPIDHWRTQAEQASPGISTSPDWPAVVDLLHHAQSHGYDVSAMLSQTLQHPLDPDHGAATQLRLRIAEAIEPTSSTAAANTPVAATASTPERAAEDVPDLSANRAAGPRR